MSNATLNALLKEYEAKKYVADLNFEKNKASFYNSHPEIAKMNSELGKLALNISKAVLNNDIDLSNKLKLEFNKLKEKKEALMNSIEIPKRCFKSYIRMPYLQRYWLCSRSKW